MPISPKKFAGERDLPRMGTCARAKGVRHTRHFQHAVERGNVVAALAAAAQLDEVGLADALALCVLLEEREPSRFDRAAVRCMAATCSRTP
jgi:hypothetical protein